MSLRYSRLCNISSVTGVVGLEDIMKHPKVLVAECRCGSGVSSWQFYGRAAGGYVGQSRMECRRPGVRLHRAGWQRRRSVADDAQVVGNPQVWDYWRLLCCWAGTYSSVSSAPACGAHATVNLQGGHGLGPTSWQILATLGAGLKQ
eukprot:2466399-Pyramimonas_sp.AAC.1